MPSRKPTEQEWQEFFFALDVELDLWLGSAARRCAKLLLLPAGMVLLGWMSFWVLLLIGLPCTLANLFGGWAIQMLWNSWLYYPTGLIGFVGDSFQYADKKGA